MSKTIGIDLGTNHSCMAVFSGDQSVVIPSSEGSPHIPSWVAFLPDGERLTGEAAKLQAAQNPKNTIFSVKRLLGKKFAELEEELRHLPYQVEEDGNGNPLICCELENGPVRWMNIFIKKGWWIRTAQSINDVGSDVVEYEFFILRKVSKRQET